MQNGLSCSFIFGRQTFQLAIKRKNITGTFNIALDLNFHE